MVCNLQLRDYHCSCEPGCSYETTGPARSTEISVSATGMKIFQLRDWLNGRLAASVAVFWLIWQIFHFKSIPFSCSNKVTRVEKATARGTIEISSRRGANFHLYSRHQAHFSSRITGTKFLIWTHDKAGPVDQDADSHTESFHAWQYVRVHSVLFFVRWGRLWQLSCSTLDAL